MSRSNNLVYTTSTNDAPDAPDVPDVEEEIVDPYCFVCGRATDHFAEHDDLVDAGKYEYRSDGSVVPVGGFKVSFG